VTQPALTHLTLTPDLLTPEERRARSLGSHGMLGSHGLAVEDGGGGGGEGCPARWGADVAERLVVRALVVLVGGRDGGSRLQLKTRELSRIYPLHSNITSTAKIVRCRCALCFCAVFVLSLRPKAA
jgi:hypothetical protein